MRQLDILTENEQTLNAERGTWQPAMALRSRLTTVDLAWEYGFERHHRVYACPLDFADNDRPSPSFLEALLGDG